MYNDNLYFTVARRPSVPNERSPNWIVFDRGGTTSYDWQNADSIPSDLLKI